MSARLYPDASYVNGRLLPAAYWQALDLGQSQLINPESQPGGAWSPISPIVIGGAGMWCAGPWELGSSPAIEDVASSGKRVVHGDSDWVNLGSGHSAAARVLRTSLIGGASYWLAVSGVNVGTAAIYDPNSHGSESIPVQANALNSRISCPMRVHHGASLQQVQFWFLIGNAHSGGLPSSLPQFRVLQVDQYGNETPMGVGASIAGSGWQQMTAASSSAYYNGGAIQGFDYQPDSGIVIDTSQYAYVAQVIDEAGTTAFGGNTFVDVYASLALIQDIRPQ